MSYSPPALGCSRADLDTPCLIVDLDALERNIARMVAFFRQQGVAWRPHAKSYKCGPLAKKVVDAGAIGVTCARLDEAEAIADSGVTDLLITTPLAGEGKMRRLAELRRRADPIATIDHPDHVAAISAAASRAGVTIRVVIEVDIGLKRCGVAPGEATVALAQQVVAAPGLRFAGILGWEGHLLTIDDRAEKTKQIRAALELLGKTKAALEAAGIPCPIVTAGGTGSYPITAASGIATEIEAGGGIFCDQFYRQKCGIVEQELALSILATVVSRPTADRVVIDAGRKSMNTDVAMPAVKGRDDVKAGWFSAEHGVLEVVSPPGPRIGERLEIIPGYGDLTTILHDRYFLFRGDRLEEVWTLDAKPFSKTS